MSNDFEKKEAKEPMHAQVFELLGRLLYVCNVIELRLRWMYKHRGGIWIGKNPEELIKAMNKAVDEQQDKSELLKIRMQNAWNSVNESYQLLQIAHRSIEQAEENLRLNRDYYKAGTIKMSDLLEAQLLYQQSFDKCTDAWVDYQNRLLEYKQSVGQ